jgi:hypothetical protein
MSPLMQVAMQKGALNEYLRPLDAVLVYPNGLGAVLLSEREADAILGLMWEKSRRTSSDPYLVNLAYERDRLAADGTDHHSRNMPPPKLQVFGHSLHHQQAGEAWIPRTCVCIDKSGTDARRPPSRRHCVARISRCKWMYGRLVVPCSQPVHLSFRYWGGEGISAYGRFSLYDMHSSLDVKNDSSFLIIRSSRVFSCVQYLHYSTNISNILCIFTAHTYIHHTSINIITAAIQCYLRY